MNTPRIRLNKGASLGVLVAALLAAVVLLWQPLEREWRLGRARRSLQEHDDEQGLDELRAALRLAPDRAETLFLLARAHRRLGHLDKVAPLLRSAEKAGGDPLRAQRETWLLLAQTGDLRQAEPHLARLLAEAGADGPDVCAAYVQGYFANLRVHEAIQLLDAWQKDYPRDAQPHFMRAFLLQALARAEEAVAAYRAGLELGPGDALTRCRMAQALVELRQLDEAAGLLRRSADEAPDNPEVLTAWADCLFQQGDADQARRVLDQLFSRTPGHFEARRLAGEVALAQGRLEEALEHLERAMTQRPYDTTTHNALGKTLRALGRNDEARPHLDYVAEAEPALGRMERQLQDVVTRPDDAELRYQIGVTLLEYGSPDDGAKWLATVLQLDPEHEKAHRALVGFYEARGDWEKALAHRIRAAAP